MSWPPAKLRQKTNYILGNKLNTSGREESLQCFFYPKHEENLLGFFLLFFFFTNLQTLKIFNLQSISDIYILFVLAKRLRKHIMTFQFFFLTCDSVKH